MCVTSLQCDYAEAKANALDVECISKREAITDVLVGGGIATETALGWLLNALGFTAASKAVYDSRDSLLEWTNAIKDDLIQVAQERYTDLKIDSASFEEWLQQVASGTLDKTSDCWQALKRYLTEAKTGSVSTSDANVIECDGLGDFVRKAVENFSTTFDNTNISSIAETGDVFLDDSYQFQKTYQYYLDGEYTYESEMYSKKMYTGLPLMDGDVTFRLVNFVFPRKVTGDRPQYDTYTVAVNPSYSKHKILPFFETVSQFKDKEKFTFRSGVMNSDFNYCGFVAETVFGTYSISDTYQVSTIVFEYGSSILTKNGIDYGDIVLPAVACGVFGGYEGWNVKVKNPVGDIAKEVADSIAVAPETQEILDRDKTLDNVDVVTTLDVPADVAIPIDLENVKVGDLAIPYTDAVPKVKTVDTVKDVTLPNKNPVVKEKPSNKTGEFTLSGLEQVFPFCIPWDLKSLYGSLTAEAQAPKFIWKFFYMNNGKMVSKNIEIDLSKFDTVAKYVRTMELLAFMLFITLKTRDLIRG